MTYTILASLFDIGFGLFHLAFWRLFGWPATLVGSGKINAAVTQTLNAMLTYCFFAYALALIWSTTEEHSPLLAWAGAGFWLLRAALQPLLFSARHRLSVAMTILFLAGAALHTAAGLAPS